MNFFGMDPETRRFGLLLHGMGAGATVLVAMVAYTMVYAPMVSATNTAQAEIKRLDTALLSAPAIRSEHKQLKERLANVTRRFEQLRAHVPEDAMVSQFVSQVTEAAEKEGVTISDIDTGQPVARDGYSEREIEFIGTGRYASLCQLVDRIRKLPRRSKVTGLHIQTEAYGQEVHPINLRAMIYFGIHVVESKSTRETDDG